MGLKDQSDPFSDPYDWRPLMSKEKVAELMTALKRAERERDAAHEKLKAARREAEELRWVPGCWRCPECDFGIQKNVTDMSSGRIGADPDRSRDVCPNDGKTLQPVSWIEWSREASDGHLALADQRNAAEAQAERLREAVERAQRHLRDLARGLRQAHVGDPDTRLLSAAQHVETIAQALAPESGEGEVRRCPNCEKRLTRKDDDGLFYCPDCWDEPSATERSGEGA